MVRATCVLFVLAALSVPGARALAGEDSWSGTWVTDEGAMTLTQDGDSVSGTYGRGGEIEAKVSGSHLQGTFRVGNSTGDLDFERKQPGQFEGKWTRSGGAGGTWRGWRRDEAAESSPAANFAGYWLTSIGILRLEQEGARVFGPWRNQGWATIKGTAKGRRLEAALEQPSWRGKVWLETTADGKRLYGLTDESPPAAVIG